MVQIMILGVLAYFDIFRTMGSQIEQVVDVSISPLMIRAII
jgi:hypothetical protein